MSRAVTSIVVCDGDFFFRDAVFLVGIVKAVCTGGREVIDGDSRNSGESILACPAGAKELASQRHFVGVYVNEGRSVSRGSMRSVRKVRD